MKNIIALFILILISYSNFGQQIVKNEVDEFTGKTLKATSWETLNKKSSLYSYVRFQKVDNTLYFYFKMMIGNGKKVYSVDQGEVLLLKFSDDEIIKVTNLEYEITTHGAGAKGLSGSNILGAELVCLINKEILNKFKEKTISKVRVITSIGYVEAEVNEKQAEKFKELASLLE